MLCRMKIKTYLDSLPHGGKKSFAESLGVPATYLYQLAAGLKRPSAQLAVKIEQMSDGEVRLEDMLPEHADQWDYIRGTDCPCKEAAA